jgi:type VI secretion system protein ImpF
MAKADTEANVTQSVLDRLLDLELREAADPQFSRAMSVRNYKAGVRRDLQWLLNTKRTPEPAGPDYFHSRRSLFNYGIPDFSVLSSTSHKDRNRLLTEMEECIGFFEPRLKNVKVTLVNTDGLTTKMLRFQIEATLMMDPSPEQVSFDTVLDVVSGDYEVKGERGA